MHDSPLASSWQYTITTVTYVNHFSDTWLILMNLPDDYEEPKLSSEFKTLSHYGRKIYNTSKLKVTHVSLYTLHNPRDV